MGLAQEVDAGGMARAETVSRGLVVIGQGGFRGMSRALSWGRGEARGSPRIELLGAKATMGQRPWWGFSGAGNAGVWPVGFVCIVCAR